MLFEICIIYELLVNFLYMKKAEETSAFIDTSKP